MEIEVGGVLRHACLTCGGSCQGVQVPLVSEAEVTRVHEQAGKLGVSDPVTDGRLRRVGGRCVFLDDANLCRIHAEWGLLAKPTVCRQYPMVAVRVGESMRVGIDPGCFTAIQTWRTGPEVPPGSLLSSASPHPPQVDALENQILAILDAQDALGPALAIVCQEGGAWPEAFLTRWLAAVKGIGLTELLADPDTSPSLSESLGPMAQAIATWDVPPGPPTLSDEATEYALDAVQRMVWLRLCAKLPSPAVVALLSLAGAVTCAWTHPGDDEAFGRALAGWCRAIRAPAVLGRLLPSPSALQQLVEG